jgi:hypothetical protein
MEQHLRIARPVTDLPRAASMYCAALDLQVLATFADHQGFDGIMVGTKSRPYHLEFTCHRGDPVVPRPTADDLLVFYLPDRREWEARCAAMVAAGFQEVASFNPYWDLRGRTFEDPDGYRTVLQHAAWTHV